MIVNMNWIGCWPGKLKVKEIWHWVCQKWVKVVQLLKGIIIKKKLLVVLCSISQMLAHDFLGILLS